MEVLNSKMHSAGDLEIERMHSLGDGGGETPLTLVLMRPIT